MKRVRFLKTVFLEGKPVWYKNCWYNVEKEWVNNINRTVYGLIGEDLIMRGIDTDWAKMDNLIEVEEIPDKKEETKPQVINTEKFETKVESEHPVVEKKVEQTIPKKSNNKKRKSNKK